MSNPKVEFEGDMMFITDKREGMTHVRGSLVLGKDTVITMMYTCANKEISSSRANVVSEIKKLVKTHVEEFRDAIYKG